LSTRAATISRIPPFLRPYLKRIETSPTATRLVRGAFWSLSGALISRVLGLVSSFVVARILGKSGFGELGIIQSTVGMFQVFAAFGLGLTATKYVSELRVSDPQKAGRIIGLSSLAAVATGGIIASTLLLFAPWLASHSLAAPQLTGVLRISSALLFLGALNGAQTGALAGFEKFKAIARVNLLAGLVAFPLMIAGTYLAGLEGAVWGLVGSMAVNWFLNSLALNSACRESGVPRLLLGAWREYKVLWRFSLPALLNGVMVSPAIWLCNAMLVNQPGGYGEMGIFNAANQWRAAILFLPTVVEAIILPICSSLRGEGNWTGYKKVLLYNVYFNAGITLLAALAVSPSGSLILRGYGRGFEAGRIVLLVLCLSAVLSATIGVSGQFIASEDRMWAGMFLNFLWAIALITSNWLLMGKGALGLSLANLIAYGVHFVTVGAYCFYLFSTNKRKFEMLGKARLPALSVPQNRPS